MTTTRLPDHMIFEQMVAEFKKAHYTYCEARLGSARAVAAEKKMDRLVEKAENLGWLNEFVRAVHPT